MWQPTGWINLQFNPLSLSCIQFLSHFIKPYFTSPTLRYHMLSSVQLYNYVRPWFSGCYINCFTYLLAPFAKKCSTTSLDFLHAMLNRWLWWKYGSLWSNDNSSIQISLRMALLENFTSTSRVRRKPYTNRKESCWKKAMTHFKI